MLDTAESYKFCKTRCQDWKNKTQFIRELKIALTVFGNLKTIPIRRGHSITICTVEIRKLDNIEIDFEVQVFYRHWKATTLKVIIDNTMSSVNVSWA